MPCRMHKYAFPCCLLAFLAGYQNVLIFAIVVIFVIAIFVVVKSDRIVVEAEPNSNTVPTI